MKNEKQTPALRFRGFDGPWEKKTFSAMAERVSIFTDDSTLPRVEYEDIISGQGRLNKDVYKKNSTKSGIRFSKGQILFGKLRPYLKNWMYASFEGIAVGDFWVLQPTSADGLFLYYLIQSVAFQSVTNQTTGTKMPRADWKIVSKAEFVVPASQEEQHKIGIVLRDFDEKIFAQEQKIKKAEQFRRAMLSKLFPAEGASEPALRFRGFSGPWEKYKLGDCFEERTERSDEGELISVTMNQGIKKFSELGRHDNSSDDKSNYKKVCVGDIAYNSMRMWQGASGYSPYDGIVSPAYTVIVPRDNVDARFFSYLLKHPQAIYLFRLNSQGITSDTWNLKFPAFSQISIYAPAYEEQKKIADFFWHLDDFLFLQKEKLKKLRRLKAALLEKLFV